MDLLHDLYRMSRDFPAYKRHQRDRTDKLADEISTAAQHAQLSDGPCSKDPLTKPCFLDPDEWSPQRG